MSNFTIADSLFIYDSNTGIFTWRCNHSNIKAGTRAGYTNKHNKGYRMLQMYKKRYYEHRVAWLLYYGEWPRSQLDHINGNKSDNRISNLRECTQTQNLMNYDMFPTNTSGVRGVRFRKERNKWTASINHGGKGYRLGHFDTKEEAIAARRAKEIELYGEFSRLV